MNTSDQACRCYLDYHRIFHQHLRALLMDTQAALEAIEHPDQHNFHRVIDLLVQIRGELQHHLAQELGGACLEEAVIRYPRIAPEVRHLEGQFPALLQQVDHLIERANQPHPTAARQALLQRDLGRLAKQLAVLETTENQLLQQGFRTE